jgi:hypothetical protein
VAQRQIRSAWLALAMVMLVACKGESDEPPKSKGEEERTIVTLQSYVYAAPDDTSFKTAGRIRDQIKSAFGALKSLRVTASNREVSNDAGEQLYKEPLMLIGRQGRESLVFRVWFRYTDEVLAPAGAPRGVPLLVGGIHRQDEAHFTQLVTMCTANTAREREYRGRLQGVFDGSLSACQDTILAEESAIDAARVRLDAPEDEIVPEELDRVLLPVVARIYARKASQMGRYPRYEAVLPQTGRMVAEASPATGGRRPAAGSPQDDAHDDSGEPPPADHPSSIVVPGGGGPSGRQGPQPEKDPQTEEARDPDLSPDPVPGVMVVPGGGTKASMPVQPRREDSESSFNWEDLGDKKYWVLWLAVFALYPLLRRRPADG